MAYRLHRLTESWQENTVTWSNRPTKNTAWEDVIVTDSSTGWWVFDVADLIQEWEDGSHDNYGLAILSPADCTLVTIYSSDNSNDTLHPRLTVEYTVNSAVEEATWGQIKADL